MDAAIPVAERLQTLTLQDLIWVNLVATRKVNAFDYDKLEQAAFRQFGYGTRQNVQAQAAGLLGSLLRLRPFAEGNGGTALIAYGAFLALNGIALVASSEQARALVAGTAEMGSAASDAPAGVTEPDPDWKPTMEPDLRRIVTDLAERYASVLSDSAAG